MKFLTQIYADNNFKCTCCCPPPKPGHGKWVTCVDTYATLEDAITANCDMLDWQEWPWRVIDEDGNILASGHGSVVDE